MTLEKRIRAHAMAGARAWFLFGVVEAWFASLLPRALALDYQPRPEATWAILAYLAAYTVLGGLIGGVAAFMREGPAPAVVAASSIPIVVGLRSILTIDGQRWEINAISLAACILCLFLIVIARSRVRLDALPWLVPLVTIGVPWSGIYLMRNGPPVARVVAMGLCVFLILLCGWLSYFVRGGYRVALAYLTILLTIAFSVWESREVEVVRRPFPESRMADRRTVILAVWDTVSADHLSLYGYERETTPFLENLAMRSTVYDRAIAPSNVTLTSHASMMTGKPGSAHGAHWTGEGLWGVRGLAQEEVTLAEILRREGFATIGVVANSGGFLDPDFNIDQGFSTYDYRPNRGFPAKQEPLFFRAALAEVIGGFVPLDRQLLTRRADAINDAALIALEEAGDRPVFLFLNYMEGHSPYVPEPGREVGNCRGMDASKMLAMESELFRRQLSDGMDLLPDERRYLQCQYDGAIRSLDHAMSELLEQLRRLGRADDALIIITSDHGEAFDRHPYYFHATSLFEEQVHVPLLVKFPHQNRPRRVSEPTSTSDVFGIILGEMGVQNHAVVPWGSDVVTEAFPLDGEDHFPYDAWMGRAFYEGTWKYLESASGESLLFNISDDPSENANILAREIERSGRMRRTLSEWVDRVDPVTGGPAGTMTGGGFRALGYLQ